MGHGNPAVSRRRDSGRDAGNLLKFHPVLEQKLQFLSSPAKNKWIAPLQPHHVPARLGLLQQNAVDGILRDRGMSRDHVSGPRSQGEELARELARRMKEAAVCREK